MLGLLLRCLQPRLIDQLIKERKLIAETRTDLVQTGIGIEVKAGAHKPDISSVEAFKHALLIAKSVACLIGDVDVPSKREEIECNLGR